MTSFTIIPVLDLKHGAVVRARAGDRINYHPIVSPLAADSSPANILHGLRGLAPFRVVYIAKSAGGRLLARRRLCDTCRGKARLPARDCPSFR